MAARAMVRYSSRTSSLKCLKEGVRMLSVNDCGDDKRVKLARGWIGVDSGTISAKGERDRENRDLE